MATKTVGVSGVYRSRKEAEAVVDRMRAAGFKAAGVSLLLPLSRGGTGSAPEAGALSWLEPITTLDVPPAGTLIAAGPVLEALAGGAGARPGVAAALKALGLPEEDARRYERRVQAGEILLNVQCDNAEWAVFAKDLLRNSGAQDVVGNPEALLPPRPPQRPLNAFRRL